MSATLIPTARPGDIGCRESLSDMNESLRRREQLLESSARASRILLQAPDVRGVIPDVLRLIGEAARVDRVNLMLAQRGPNGERLLVMVSEWVAEGATSHLHDLTLCTCVESDFSTLCAELRSGRTVCLSQDDLGSDCAAVGLQGIGTKTKAIVPIFVAGEFIGVVGFDNTSQLRAIDWAELAALETAAGVIGAALHRERLIDDVRRERERAAEERVTELAKANTLIRGNLERLSSEPDLQGFMGHMLLQATRQFEATSGSVIVLMDATQEWRVVSHVRDGQVQEPPFPVSVPVAGSPFTWAFARRLEPVHVDTGGDAELWPGVLAFHRQHGYAGAVVYPLVFNARNVGFIVLSFARPAPEVPRSELLVALAQQATLAIQLTRLGNSERDAAVLKERARIGQEIHDGLAQSFTGILMQLGAAEEFMRCKRRSAALGSIFTRIRELARDGLAEARRSVMALRLDQTRSAGLERALRQLADRSTVTGGLVCSFEGGGFATGLKPEQEHELLRIAQEAVSNAVRHGHPSQVHIAMTESAEGWELTVSDDGVGLAQPPELSAREGFGLNSMRQRASAIGGEWQIETSAGAGTRVRVRIPKRRAA